MILSVPTFCDLQQLQENPQQTPLFRGTCIPNPRTSTKKSFKKNKLFDITKKILSLAWYMSTPKIRVDKSVFFTMAHSTPHPRHDHRPAVFQDTIQHEDCSKAKPQCFRSFFRSENPWASWVIFPAVLRKPVWKCISPTIPQPAIPPLVSDTNHWDGPYVKACKSTVHGLAPRHWRCQQKWMPVGIRANYELSKPRIV